MYHQVRHVQLALAFVQSAVVPHNVQSAPQHIILISVNA